MVLRDRDGVVVGSWTVPWRGRAGLEVVDDLARLALLARRAGHTLRVVRAAPEVVEVLALAGLSDLLAEPAGGPPDPAHERPGPATR